MRCVSDPDALDVLCIPLPLLKPCLVRDTRNSFGLAKKSLKSFEPFRIRLPEAEAQPIQDRRSNPGF